MLRRLSLALLLLAGPAAAQRAAPFTVAETGESFDSLQDAVDAVGDGSGTIRIAPGRHSDCAVQEEGRIAFVAVEPGTALFDGGICEDKATLVLRGRSARVEGLTFVNLAVEDGNGAGIRIEQGDLDVAWTLFADSECGILSADDPQGAIRIDRSTFRGLGRNRGGDSAHSLYVGRYGALVVTRSRFERGVGGHYLKSRAPRVEIVDNSFDDSRGKGTNYLIDLSEGAAGRIAGNVLVQGRDKDNFGTLIAIAPEGTETSPAGLIVERNEASLAPGFRGRTAFVGDWSGEPPLLRGNRLGARIVELERR